MSAWARRGLLAVAVGVGLLALLAAVIAWLNLRGEEGLDAMPATGVPANPAAIARGAYLARAGNCMGCHTARGGEPFAGGRGIQTPFGTVYASNLTPDATTGLGGWSAAEFWRALHHGRSKDGRLLTPAFPYPNFTLVTRADADSIYAYLRSVPAVLQANRPHDLRFPFNQQAALAVWRALYFEPARFEPDPAQSAAWNRGSYLVRGLGHCVACHGGRNWLGATTGESPLAGGLIPQQLWYAPSLSSSAEAGVAAWSDDEVVALLKTGISPRGSAMGPMAEVVFRSTQHLDDEDLRAMATYLRCLPATEPSAPSSPVRAANAESLRHGAKLYTAHCASCHGEQGEGLPDRIPPLKGNRAVTLAAPNNVIKAIVHGGFAPTTAGNPRPYGMPPFGQALRDEEIAALATHIRQSWGHRAGAVSSLDVLQTR